MGATVEVGERRIRSLAANHTVPALASATLPRAASAIAVLVRLVMFFLRHRPQRFFAPFYRALNAEFASESAAMARSKSSIAKSKASE